MSTPKIGLGLGAGAARGLAHITVLEAFDDLGIKPSLIVGTSIGALIGGSYAAGLDARAIRDHAEAVLGKRVSAARRVLARDKGSIFRLINFNPLAAPLIDGLQLARFALPPAVARQNIEDTVIPFKVIATDFFGHCEVEVTSGIMEHAIAASIAIPGVIAGPHVNGRPLVDGGCVNPVPFDRAREGMDIVIGVDVIGSPMPRPRRPSSFELLTGALQIQQKQISALRRAVNPPDIYIEPEVDRFRVHEFFRLRDILKAAEPARERLKRALGTAIDMHERRRPAAE
jgi:NTE family protein